MYDNYKNSDFEETNPEKRIPIVITGNEGQVYIDEINIEGSDNPPGTTIVDRCMREQQLDIYFQLRLINKTINSLHNKIEGDKLNCRRFQMLNKNIQRISMLACTR